MHYYYLSTPPAKEYLKSKLLKIAGTGENGAEHAGLPGSLSRTAKLVLAASSSNQKAFSPEVKSLGADKLGMFSSHIDQKYGVKVCFLLHCLKLHSL